MMYTVPWFNLFLRAEPRLGSHMQRRSMKLLSNNAAPPC
jgi:hypothetical protein